MCTYACLLSSQTDGSPMPLEKERQRHHTPQILTRLCCHHTPKHHTTSHHITLHLKEELHSNRPARQSVCALVCFLFGRRYCTIVHVFHVVEPMIPPLLVCLLFLNRFRCPSSFKWRTHIHFLRCLFLCDCGGRMKRGCPNPRALEQACGVTANVCRLARQPFHLDTRNRPLIQL